MLSPYAYVTSGTAGSGTAGGAGTAGATPSATLLALLAQAASIRDPHAGQQAVLSWLEKRDTRAVNATQAAARVAAAEGSRERMEEEVAAIRTRIKALATRVATHNSNSNSNSSNSSSSSRSSNRAQGNTTATTSGGRGGSTDDVAWAAFVHSIAADWTLVRYINSCYPISRRHQDTGGVCIDEAQLLASICEELDAAAAGVGALRLQVKHRPGDPLLLQRVGTVRFFLA
jgi:hypothetical protein